jgi:N-acetylmuramoyl-L-alanine amidase
MKFNVQSAALRLVAIGLAALMLVLALSGLQAIAKVNLIPVSRVAQINLAAFPADAADADELEPSQMPQDIWSSIPFPTPTSLTTLGFSPASPARAASGYVPPQEIAIADPSNFGDRYAKDINGKPVHNEPLVVLHETVGTADSAINTFKAPHPNEDDQVSYHCLIRRDGTVIYVVSPEKRAFGAGNSGFKAANGVIEAVKTHRLYPPSVNNFAYHISLESPDDGHDNASTHSGYSDTQYQSLAWLVAKTNIPDERIATHRGVDRSGSRIDPRSFNGRKFFNLLHNYPRPAQGSEAR